MAAGSPRRQADGMTPILIRCTTHRQLSHEDLAAWIDARRAGLVATGRGVRHVNAGRLGTATWVLELHGSPGDEADLDAAASALFADLCLLGTRPTVFAPVAAGGAASEQRERRGLVPADA